MHLEGGSSVRDFLVSAMKECNFPDLTRCLLVGRGRGRVWKGAWGAKAPAPKAKRRRPKGSFKVQQTILREKL